MTGLLLGVFAFFGIHLLLWLQRGLVGKMRGEFKAGHGGHGPYVRRFSRAADLDARLDRGQLPAAVDHRPAAQVRDGAVGRHDDQVPRRRALRGHPPPHRRDHHVRLLCRAPGRAGLRRGSSRARAASSGAGVRWCRS